MPHPFDNFVMWGCRVTDKTNRAIKICRRIEQIEISLLIVDTPTATNKLNAELKDLESELAGIYVADNKCMCTNCDNRATHIWSGFNVCDACGAPGRRSLR